MKGFPVSFIFTCILKGRISSKAAFIVWVTSPLFEACSGSYFRSLRFKLLLFFLVEKSYSCKSGATCLGVLCRNMWILFRWQMHHRTACLLVSLCCEKNAQVILMSQRCLLLLSTSALTAWWAKSWWCWDVNRVEFLTNICFLFKQFCDDIVLRSFDVKTQNCPILETLL